MTRCLFCRRRVWPWQSQGWVVGVARWHGRCRAAYRDDPEAWRLGVIMARPRR